MHADEIDTDESLVRRLVRAQYPQWAELPIRPVQSSGTDNAIYRLGNEMSVRLPRIERAAAQVEKEHRWLPHLAPHLPLAIPVPLAKGMPGEGYPWPWSVARWLPGHEATGGRIANLRQAALDLAAFIVALQKVDPTGGPAPSVHDFGRGAPLATRDGYTRATIAKLYATINTDAVTAAWEAALAVPRWEGRPLWIHGDLQSGNLLVEHGRLSGVIDFGGLGVGDPACDLMPAWTIFSGQSRESFRARLAADDATWARARGWALSVALIFIPYYLKTNPSGVAIARRTVKQVLADCRKAP